MHTKKFWQLSVIAALVGSFAWGAARIQDADVKTNAAIVFSKMAALSASRALETSAGGVVVVSSFGPATNANTASTLVARNGSGNFSAGTISAALTGNASTATALAANPSACSAGQFVVDIDANGTLSCGTPSTGGLLSVTTITANTTLVNTNNAIICNAVAGGFTVTLETAVGNSGVVHHLKKSDTTTNIVTVDANGSQTIDGDLTLALTDPLVSITIVSDGSNWHVL